jgi:hypothetical protein
VNLKDIDGAPTKHWHDLIDEIFADGLLNGQSNQFWTLEELCTELCRRGCTKSKSAIDHYCRRYRPHVKYKGVRYYGREENLAILRERGGE